MPGIALPPTAGAALSAMRRRFRKAGLQSADLDAALLLQHLAGFDRLAILKEPESGLTDDQISRLEAAATRRLHHEPVHRIIGSRGFYGRDFRLSEATLEPRSDTECLIDLAVQLMANRKDSELSILDLGTGTGILAITLVAEIPGATALAVDKSSAALDVARDNCVRNMVAGRVRFLESDWFSGVEGSFDLIISNPPYIASHEIDGLEAEVRSHDPRLALDGGEDGLMAFRQIAGGAGRHLRQGGLVLVEIGQGQLAAVTAIFESQGFAEQRSIKDFSGIERGAAFARNACFGAE